VKRTRLALTCLLATLPAAACSKGEGENAGHKVDAAAPAAPVGTSGASAIAAWSVTWRPEASGGESETFDSQLTLTNGSAAPLGSSGWKLYFTSSSPFIDATHAPDGSATRATPSLAQQGLTCAHGDTAASGDDWVLEPLPSFSPIPPGGSRAIHMLASGSAILKSDSPSGFHLLLPGQSAPVAVFASVDLDSSNPRQTARSSDDALPVQTPELRYRDNQSSIRLDLGIEGRLLPSPLSVVATGGEIALGPSVTIQPAGGLESEAAYLEAALRDVLGGATVSVMAPEKAPEKKAAIALSLNPDLDVTGDGAADPEGYTLTADDSGVKIAGTDSAGVFYAIQTLRQLIPLVSAPQTASVTIPKVIIADAPLFHYRGMHLDVARHFESKETILRLIDLLSVHKINKFHFHLTDDEGWRLEIPDLPELTDYGSRRGFDPAEAKMLHIALGSGGGLTSSDGIAQKKGDEAAANGGTAPSYQGFEVATLNFVGNGSGYYTTADFEQILTYAAERHVDVIPEVDMPAHARAAVRSMEARYAKYHGTDEARAAQYRLIDPADTTRHTSVQGYTDNLMNPCLDSTYAFIAKVVAEIKARYDAAHVKLLMFHAGGDEPPGSVWWAGSPACRASTSTRALRDVARKDSFFKKVSAIALGSGAKMAGWDDVIQKGLRISGFVSMPWSNVWGSGGEDQAYKQANSGQSVILAHATNLYMDLAYEKDPDEPGGTWGGFVDERKTFDYLPFDIFSNATQDAMGHAIPASKWATAVRLTKRASILGLEGLLWGENRKTPALLEYMAFPKMLGVAERAWNRHMPTPQTLGPAWTRFVNTLGQAELPRLDAYRPVDVRREIPQPRAVGVNYRIPPPGARIENGQLLANTRYPGLALEISTDGGKSWVAYSAPLSVTGSVLVRAKTSSGRAGRVAKVN
jgi:hexosaminidase